MHLATSQRVLRVRRKSRITDLPDFRMLLKPGGQGEGVGTMALHPQRQRFQTAHSQETVERTGDRANRILEKSQPLDHWREVGPIAHHRDTAYDVRVAIEILGRRVDHEVESDLQWALDPGTGECVVANREKPIRRGEA